MDTTFNFHGSQAALPGISADTTVTVPRAWPDAPKLFMPAGTLDKSAALGCFLIDSNERHASAPEVKVGGTDPSSLDTISLREQVSVNNGYGKEWWLMGHWVARFAMDAHAADVSVTHTDGSVRAEKLHLERGDILVTLNKPRPDLPTAPSVMDKIDVHLDLSGAALVRAERIPATFADSAHASWRIDDPTNDYAFWMLIRPDPQVAMPLLLQHSWVSAVSTGMPWLCFLAALAAVLFIGRRRLRASSGARTALIDAAVLLSVMAGVLVARLVADIAWTRGTSETGPGDLAFRMENIVFVAVASVLAWRFLAQREWMKVCVVLLGVAAVAAYLIQGNAPANPPESLFAEQAWQMYLYVGIAAGIATVVLTSCLLVASRSLPSARNDPQRHARPRAWIIAVSLAAVVVLIAQGVRATIEDGNLRRFDPDGPADASTSAGWVLTHFAWLPDYFLTLVPLTIFYSVVVILVLFLRTMHKDGADSDVEPGAAELSVVCLLFAALAVGVFGWYRGVGVALAFLLTFSVTLWIVLRRRRSAHEMVLRIAGKTSLADLQLARQRLLHLSKDAHSPVWREQLVALGPRVTAWGNGVYGGSIAAVAAVPIVIYDLFALGREGSYSSYWISYTGLFDALQWLFFEVLHWVVPGFALGYLWRLIPGQRGPYKALVLCLPLIGGLLVDAVLAALVDQAPWPPDIGQWGVIVTVVLIVGVVLDVASLRNVEAEGWDVVSVLRLRNTRWLAAYGFIALAIILNLVKIIGKGEPITNLPFAFLSELR